MGLLETAWDLAPMETKRFAAAAGRVAELSGRIHGARESSRGEIDKLVCNLEQAREREDECRKLMGDALMHRMIGIGSGSEGGGGGEVQIGDSVYSPL